LLSFFSFFLSFLPSFFPSFHFFSSSSFSSSSSSSSSFFEIGSYYVAQVDFKLVIFLPQPLKCWNSKCAPPTPRFYSRLIGGGSWVSKNWSKLE
jgi:hypothetical protein